MPSSSSGPRPCDFVDDVSPGGAAIGIIQVGNNGSGGASELTLTTGGGTASGDVTWDSDLSNGLDSGWVGVQMTVEAQDGATLSAGTGSLSRGGVPGRVISKVQIKAAVSVAGGGFAWRAITIQYFGPGSSSPRQSETLADPCNPAVDGTGSTVVQSTPLDANNTKVVISGQVNLRNSGNQLPGASALSGQIHVFTS